MKSFNILKQIYYELNKKNAVLFILLITFLVSIILKTKDMYEVGSRVIANS
jgi:hypothetical protein